MARPPSQPRITPSDPTAGGNDSTFSNSPVVEAGASRSSVAQAQGEIVLYWFEELKRLAPIK